MTHFSFSNRLIVATAISLSTLIGSTASAQGQPSAESQRAEELREAADSIISGEYRLPQGPRLAAEDQSSFLRWQLSRYGPAHHLGNGKLTEMERHAVGQALNDYLNSQAVLLALSERCPSQFTQWRAANWPRQTQPTDYKGSAPPMARKDIVEDVRSVLGEQKQERIAQLFSAAEQHGKGLDCTPQVFNGLVDLSFDAGGDFGLLVFHARMRTQPWVRPVETAEAALGELRKLLDSKALDIQVASGTGAHRKTVYYPVIAGSLQPCEASFKAQDSQGKDVAAGWNWKDVQGVRVVPGNDAALVLIKGKGELVMGANNRGNSVHLLLALDRLRQSCARS